VEPSRKIVLAVSAVAVLGLAVLLLWPEAAEKLAPELVGARVAVEVAGAGIATIGTVEIEAGTPFTVHAVVEARTREGEPLYYTEASRLSIGGREVPPTSLRRWDRPGEPKLRWFTVEGSVPYLKVERPEDLSRFTFTDFLHQDWPETWSVPGRIDPANDDELARDPRVESPPFGTQRFSLWVELYDRESPLLPRARYTAPGAAELEASPESVTAVHAVLPGPAAPASRFFGLAHLDLPSTAAVEEVARVRQWTAAHLAYEDVALLAQLMREAGKTPDEVPWRRVDLTTDNLAWGTDLEAGDLLQAGARWVVLYRDAGRAGVLDYDDLCFDFIRAPAIRPLGQVFLRGGELELGGLSRPVPRTTGR